jgi:hypothetical protein
MKHKLINRVINKDFTPTLAFIFLSVTYDVDVLAQRLKKYDFIIIGSTTVGEIFADKALGVHVQEKSISSLLVNLDSRGFALKIKKLKNQDAFVLGKKISKWAKSKFSNPAILTLTSGLHFNNESYIKGLQTKVSSIFGAAAGDDRFFKGTFVFSQGKVIEEGALALVFDQNRVEILTSRGFGWSGIGTQRVVTKSEENLVYTIDDKPAINFYQDYLHITQKDMPNMGADYPLEVELRNGEVIYRAAIHINEEDGSLIFAGHVEEGSKVRISAPIGVMVIDEVSKSVQCTYRSNEEYRADFTLVFPCAAHKALLGSVGIKEIEAVHKVTKESPLIGFYAYGEIASSSGENAFHNETFVTIQLRERK